MAEASVLPPEFSRIVSVDEIDEAGEVHRIAAEPGECLKLAARLSVAAS